MSRADLDNRRRGAQPGEGPHLARPSHQQHRRPRRNVRDEGPDQVGRAARRPAGAPRRARGRTGRCRHPPHARARPRPSSCTRSAVAPPASRPSAWRSVTVVSPATRSVNSTRRIVMPGLEIDPRQRPTLSSCPCGSVRGLPIARRSGDHRDPHRRPGQPLDDSGTHRQPLPGLWRDEPAAPTGVTNAPNRLHHQVRESTVTHRVVSRWALSQPTVHGSTGAGGRVSLLVEQSEGSRWAALLRWRCRRLCLLEGGPADGC